MINSDPAAKKPRGRPFPKGVSGNPAGPPRKEWTWRSLIVEAMEEEQETGIPAKKLLARSLVKKGLAEDVSALKEIGDRIDGKATQAVELTGRGGGPVENNLTVRFVDHVSPD